MNCGSTDTGVVVTHCQTLRASGKYNVECTFASYMGVVVKTKNTNFMSLLRRLRLMFDARSCTSRLVTAARTAEVIILYLSWSSGLSFSSLHFGRNQSLK